jgi:septum formation inhibitor MinC
MTMSQAPSAAFATSDDEPSAGAPARGERNREITESTENVSLRGTTRGLEILITGMPSAASLGERLTELLAEAPSFFAGCDARVVFERALPPGALGCLEEVATRFELRLIEISPLVTRRRRTEAPAALPPEDLALDLAEGTGRTGAIYDDAVPSLSGATPTAAAPATAAPATAAPTAAAPIAVASSASAAVAAAEVAEAMAPGARLVIGPVRSGTIVDHPGHLVVIGDVNPGAEIRAEGSIIVLGRLRGVAHAAIGHPAGFIVALSLQPQQLRIARMVARPAEADRPSDGAEIAYAAGETIVVERFLGRLPSGLAASM